MLVHFLESETEKNQNSILRKQAVGRVYNHKLVHFLELEKQTVIALCMYDSTCRCGETFAHTNSHPTSGEPWGLS